MEFLIILLLTVKGATMDDTGERLLKTCCCDHLAILPIVSHLNEVVDVGVVAWCFVVHVLSIDHLNQHCAMTWTLRQLSQGIPRIC